MTYHKHLKKVLNTAIAMNFIAVNPYNSFKVTRNETHRDYLAVHEIEQIRNKKICTLRMENIRDVFVFACYTGLSFAELKRLSSHHIFLGDDGGKWIIIDRTKTDIRCSVTFKNSIILQINELWNFLFSDSFSDNFLN